MTRTPSRSAFYVGYLPLPRAHRAFLALAIPALVLGSVGLAVAIASAQRDPGAAVWDTGELREWSGIVVTEPFPMLIPADGSPTHLLVQTGKRGGAERITQDAPFAATVRGWQLRREGRRIIELDDADDAITPTDAAFTPPPVRTLATAYAIRGEILDSKCYLGAMKPGDGKGHKACAILCIRGGIPAMVAGATPDGFRTVLLTVAGEPIPPDEVLDLVAEPVEITGTLTSICDLLILDAPSDAIAPLTTP